MKKFLFLFSLVLCSTLHALAFEVGDFSYEYMGLNGRNKHIVHCTGLSEQAKRSLRLKIDIPYEITFEGDKYYVERIRENAFKGTRALNKCVINRGIEIIEKNAFADCPFLDSISIFADSIQQYAFSKSRVKYAYIAQEVKRGIDHTTFYGCPIEEFEVKSRYYSALQGSLYNWDESRLIRMRVTQNKYILPLPVSCTTIGKYALYGCKNFETMCVPYGVQSIEDGAFEGMTSATSIEIPSSVKTMGDSVFKDCSSLSDLYINCYNVPAITKSSMFDGAANPHLHVQRQLVDAYKQAGWTGFKSYNKDDIVPQDYVLNNLSYTITSVNRTQIDDESYAGTARLVRGHFSSDITDSVVTVPSAIKVRYKQYAVTRIDDCAFNIPGKYSLSGCELIDSVGKQAFMGQRVTSVSLPRVSIIQEEAFADCSLLTSAKWGNRLKRIEKWGFSSAPLEHNIILPVGFQSLGYMAFLGTKSKLILVPSTLTQCSAECFSNMSLTTTFIINAPVAFSSNMYLYFNNVPTNATIYVPVEQLDAARTHHSWKYFSNIKAGAYDFSLEGYLETPFKMTVTSNTPITVDGVTYDGKAKYVYNSRVQNLEKFFSDNVGIDIMCGGKRRYLMTEIGDEFAQNSYLKAITIERMLHLERIGARAFMNSDVESITLPSNSISFGTDAFTDATKLKQIVMPGAQGFTWDGKFYGNNSSDFNFYVDYSLLNGLLNSDLADHDYSSTQKCDEFLAPCFIATGTTFNLGVNVPLNFSGSNLKAYAVTGQNNSTGLLKTRQWQYTDLNDGGVIITDLTPGKLYKVKRRYTEEVSDNPGQLLTTTTDVNIKNIANAYYWDEVNNRFVKPAGNFTVTSGRSYIVRNSTASELYLDLFPQPTTKKGDVNGDGNIDVTDVNLTINVMLGKATKAQYPASDVNGDGTVDVTDVNLIINVMLGK